MIDKLSLHNAYNTVRKMIPCSVYIHSMIIIFVINFEKWDTQTQALDIKLFDIIKKHLLYTHQCIAQNTGAPSSKIQYIRSHFAYHHREIFLIRIMPVWRVNFNNVLKICRATFGTKEDKRVDTPNETTTVDALLIY